MNTITISSKGQVTIPAEIRRRLGIKKSDQLTVSYDFDNQEIILSKQMDFDDVTEFAMSKIDLSAKPVKDVSEYYNKHRQENIK